MGRSRRRRRQIRRLNHGRISDLPDGVLHQILSLLPIDSAVRTSALCSRWCHLWRTNPSLDFSSYSEIAASVNCDEYIDAIDSCLCLCDSTKHFTSLSFTIDRLHTEEDCQWMAARWAAFASYRTVNSLSFKFECRCVVFIDEPSWFVTLPETIFWCRSIKTLKLHHCALSDIPAELARPIFPFLETVFLRSVAFVADTLSALISASPRLKKLNIAGLEFTDRIVISSPTLETLDVYRNLHSICYPVEIRSTPRLRFLGLCCDLTQSKTAPFANIEEVTLLNDAWKIFHDRTEWRLLVSAANNARVLGVNEWFTEFMLNDDRDFGRRLPVFGNLKHLDFCGRPDGFNWVLGLVRNMSEMPNLEELYLRLDCQWSKPSDDDDYDDDDEPDTDVDDDILEKIEKNVHCILARTLEKLKKDVLVVPPLKILTVQDFKGDAEVTTLVQFFLYEASLLEQVVLYYCQNNAFIERRVMRARKTMFAIQEASPSVKITTIPYSNNFPFDSRPPVRSRQSEHWNPLACPC